MRANKDSTRRNKQNRKRTIVFVVALLLLLLIIWLIYSLTIGKQTYYQDLDGDGYGNPAISVSSIWNLNGFVTDSSDTDDNDFCVPPNQICQLIEDFLAAEDSRDLNTILSFYQFPVKRSYDKYDLDKEKISDVYKKLWNATKSGTNELSKIENEGENQFRYSTNFTWTENNGTIKEVSSVIQINLEEGKISEIFPTDSSDIRIVYKPDSTVTPGDSTTGVNTLDPGGKKTLPKDPQNDPVSGSKKLYYADFDGDGLGDPNKEKESQFAPNGYVDNFEDKCPDRKGPQTNDGCPELSIKQNGKEAFINERFEVEVTIISKPGDSYSWSCPDCSNTPVSSQKTILEFDKVGKFPISVSVSNNGYQDSESDYLFVKAPSSFLEEKFKEVGKIGEYCKATVSNSDKEKAEQSQNLIMSFVTENCLIVEEPNNPFSGGGKIKSFFGVLRTPCFNTIYKNISSSRLKITKIDYDQNSGKIKKIYIAR